MFKTQIQRNRFYLTKDNRIVLPRWWDGKKRRWCVNPSRGGIGGCCKSSDLLREITPDEADEVMTNARSGFVVRLLDMKAMGAKVGVNVILPWEPLPKDYVPKKPSKRRDKFAEMVQRWL
jgi:hypothetical protein